MISPLLHDKEGEENGVLEKQKGSHNNAMTKAIDTFALRRADICKFQMEYCGRMNRTESIQMFRTAEEINIAYVSRQCPGTVGSHSLSLGMHSKMNVNMKHMVVAMLM